MATAPAQPAPKQEPQRRGIAIPKWLWDASKHADRSREGFEAAWEAARAFCAQYDWRSIEALQDELALIMQDRLRLEEITVEFIAVHWSTGRPRLEVRAGRHTARDDLKVSFGSRPSGPGGKAN